MFLSVNCCGELSSLTVKTSHTLTKNLVFFIGLQLYREREREREIERERERERQREREREREREEERWQENERGSRGIEKTLILPLSTEALLVTILYHIPTGKLYSYPINSSPTKEVH